MRMNGILGALVVLLMMARPLHAQELTEDPNEIVAKMQSQLDLNETQVSNVMQILQKYAIAFQDLQKSIEDNTISQSSSESQIQQLKAAQDQELATVLNSDQMNRWRYMQTQDDQQKQKDNADPNQ